MGDDSDKGALSMVMEARVTRGRVDGDGGESDKGALSMVMEGRVTRGRCRW